MTCQDVHPKLSSRGGGVMDVWDVSLKAFPCPLVSWPKGMIQPTGSAAVNNLHSHRRKDYELSSEKQPVSSHDCR